MFKKFGRHIISLFLIVLVVLFWVSYLGENEINQQTPSPEVRLSALPDDLQSSLKTIERRAEAKQQQINNKFIKFNFIDRFKDDIITSSTPLVLRSSYRGEIKEEVTSMPESFVGLSLAQLSSVLSKWELQEYRPGKALVLYRTISKLPPEIKKYQHLGIKDGKVAIYYGRKGNRYLKQLTNIEVDNLPERERKTLEDGIVVSSEEELLTILEGLISINQD